MVTFDFTGLTFPVVVAEIGLSLRLLGQAAAAALIGAALLSVLIFPAAALALRPWTVRSDQTTTEAVP
jgi:predicted Kef-type K+ transport protein